MRRRARKLGGTGWEIYLGHAVRWRNSGGSLLTLIGDDDIYWQWTHLGSLNGPASGEVAGLVIFVHRGARSFFTIPFFLPYPFFRHTLFFAIPFFSPYPFFRQLADLGTMDPPRTLGPLIFCPACPSGPVPGSGEAVPAPAATDGRAGGGIEIVGGGRMGRSRARGRILTKSP